MRHLAQITRLIREVTYFLLALKGLIAVLVVLADKCANWGEILFENYSAKFLHRNKYIFIPGNEANRRGEVILRFIDRKVTFPKTFFHYISGGHVAAIHRHISHAYFFKCDLEQFFYSISRNRVAAALRQFGFHDARDYAKWSCVRNPYQDPSYSLPIGFIQSPALATLTLMKTPVIKTIEEGEKLGIFTSVYLDDIVCSGNDLETLTSFSNSLLDTINLANFSAHKIIAPSSEIRVFNCSVKQGYANVSDDRIQRFIAEQRGAGPTQAFERYCEKVREKNV